MSTENENNDSGEQAPVASNPIEVQATSDEGTVAAAAAHLIGVSMPEDEHHDAYTKSDRDDLTDGELLSMGVEPDSGPTTKLIVTFLALVAVIIVVGVAVGMLYRSVSDMFVASVSSEEDYRLTALHEEARKVLGEYAVVDETVSAETESSPAIMRTVYRVPVSTGMDMLVGDTSLLDMHWLGTQTVAPTPAALPVIQREAAGTQEGSGTELPISLVVPTVVPTGTVVGDPHAGHDHAAGDHTGHGH
jgi:ABC-type nickel/cobalt efflux system permease component RcnA